MKQASLKHNLNVKKTRQQVFLRHKLAQKILGIVNEMLIQHGLPLKTGSVMDATLIVAPSSTKNKDHQRSPEMHSSKHGPWMCWG